MIWALHGAVGMAADWKDLAAGLAEHGQIVRSVDLYRYLDCCPMSLKEFGKAFCEEVRAVDDEPILLGYSMGGRLALHALLEDPEMWKKAVIVGAHAGLDTERARMERMARDAEWAALALTGDWKVFLDAWNAQPVLEGSTLGGRSQLEVRKQAVARSFMDWSLGKQGNVLPDLNRISCPVKWIVGERDQKFRTLAETAVPLVTDCDYEVAPKSGHRVPWEAQEWFLDVMRSFSLS